MKFKEWWNWYVANEWRDGDTMEKVAMEAWDKGRLSIQQELQDNMLNRTPPCTTGFCQRAWGNAWDSLAKEQLSRENSFSWDRHMGLGFLKWFEQFCWDLKDALQGEKYYQVRSYCYQAWRNAQKAIYSMWCDKAGVNKATAEDSIKQMDLGEKAIKWDGTYWGSVQIEKELGAKITKVRDSKTWVVGTTAGEVLMFKGDYVVKTQDGEIKVFMAEW